LASRGARHHLIHKSNVGYGKPAAGLAQLLGNGSNGS
jgi:hypothetical protein